jgi:hypothetical protein
MDYLKLIIERLQLSFNRLLHLAVNSIVVARDNAE